MSKLILQMQVSIDGYVDSTVPGSRWQQWNWGDPWPWTPDLRADFNTALADAAGIVLSRPMVDDGYLAHWRQTGEDHPEHSDYDFARCIGDLPKYVLSQARQPQTEWPRTTVLNGDFSGSIERAKRDAGGDLLCFGGASFANALLRSNLVDEMQLFTNPGLAGAGHRIFDASLATSTYDAIGSTAYKCGIVVTRWAVLSSAATANS
ncbi:MAG: hypothetical protein QOD39_1940 [Mycobacterium sp.]|jgi:dihydrofolate reductase|nr:hypothetical protein [Mycobacterium sp.]